MAAVNVQVVRSWGAVLIQYLCKGCDSYKYSSFSTIRLWVLLETIPSWSVVSTLAFRFQGGASWSMGEAGSYLLLNCFERWVIFRFNYKLVWLIQVDSHHWRTSDADESVMLLIGSMSPASRPTTSLQKSVQWKLAVLTLLRGLDMMSVCRHSFK